MVALLHPEHLPADHLPIHPDARRGSRPELGATADRPQLRLVEGDRRANVDKRAGADERANAGDQARLGPAVATVVMIGLVVLMLIVVLRVAQGTPPAASWEGLSEAAYGPSVDSPAIQPAAAGDLVYVVDSGDTLWAIALELGPEADPRPIVDALADRNGGPSLQIGQRLVVPAYLLVD